MAFKFISHQSIKSISQGALASQWDRMASGRRFPAFTDYTPESGTTNSKQIVVWNVESEGRRIKFRALYQGDNITEVFRLGLGRQDDARSRSDVPAAPDDRSHQGMRRKRLPRLHDCLHHQLERQSGRLRTAAVAVRMRWFESRTNSHFCRVYQQPGRGPAPEDPQQFSDTGRSSFFRQDQVWLHQVQCCTGDVQAGYR